jgi:hypothetical protein
MKKLAFMLYTWGSTLLFAFLVYWLATVPNLKAGDDMITDEVIKIIFRMTMYAILFILLYRSVILTLKTNVERLAKWRSKREEIEDNEFVLIIETLVVVMTVFVCTSFAFIEQNVQFYVEGRNDTSSYYVVEESGRSVAYIPAESINEANKGVLVSIMATLITAIVVYSIPVIGELEMGIKHRMEEVMENNRKKRRED